jgi:EXLDI family protein
MSELKEIRLMVGRISGIMGESDDTKEIKFIGRQLASYNFYHGKTSNGDDRGTTHTLYETKKGKYLLHTSNWSNWQGEYSHKRYDVYDSLEEMKEEIPDGLIYEAKEELGQDPAEELDI